MILALLAPALALEAGESVLFWSGGHLYDQPTEAVEPGRELSTTEFWPFLVLEDRGAWLRVSPVQGPGHCFANPLADLDVELWVQREHLHPVVQRRVELAHEDGSGQILLPGVAADPIDGWAHTGSFSARVQLDPGDLGLSYLPVEALQLPGLHSHLRGRELGSTPSGPVFSERGLARVYGSYGEDGRVLRDACSEHRIHSSLPVDESPPLDEPPRAELPRGLVPAGTAVWFEGGEQAGTVRLERALGRRVPGSAGSWCEAWAGLALCFRDEDLLLPAD